MLSLDYCIELGFLLQKNMPVANHCSNILCFNNKTAKSYIFIVFQHNLHLFATNRKNAKERIETF